MKSNELSVQKILELRAEGFAAVRYHSGMVLSVAQGIEALDNAIQTNVAVRGIDQQAALIAAGQQLATLLDGNGGDE